jgi:hypothetical protein
MHLLCVSRSLPLQYSCNNHYKAARQKSSVGVNFSVFAFLQRAQLIDQFLFAVVSFYFPLKARTSNPTASISFPFSSVSAKRWCPG